MCNGNGFCWYGKFGNGLCYCGGKSDIDPTGENVAVDVQLCPKGKICPGYGLTEQTETTYKALYYIIRYRQYSTFVLQLSKYTPSRGHMWFKRYTPSIAYENTCLACVGSYASNSKTVAGFWNNGGDYENFADELQSNNGFHGENCQYECGLCLNGGRCHNVPHPYRYSYTLEDSFKGEKPVFIPTTTCICSSLVYDPESMCCPKGFQPYIHYSLRLNQDPYSRFNRAPFLSGIKNEIQDYWIDRDIWLDVVEHPEYRTPYAEPANGKMYVSNNNQIWSNVSTDYVEVDYKKSGPYNKHIYYGVPRDICRACPGLFGKGVKTANADIETEAEAEEYWWDNAMGASARKCNGIGVCDFYSRPTESVVDFMGSATNYAIYERGRLCNTGETIATIGGQFFNYNTLQLCIDKGIQLKAAFVSFSAPYLGGSVLDMVSRDGTPVVYDSKVEVVNKVENRMGYASHFNGTHTLWTVLSSKTTMPVPDSNSQYTIYSTSDDTCGLFSSCSKFISVPRFNTYKLSFGRGDDRLVDATFNRFDTCFTYTKDDDTQTLGLYITQQYIQGKDPFLGGYCPKGHYCTEYENIGYKEACPAGYYQPIQGRTRTIISVRCNAMNRLVTGCQSNEGTASITDFTDNVCIRCPRNFYAEEGSAVCIECPNGHVKKISGTPVDKEGRYYEIDDVMLNFPTSFTAGFNPWYYIPNEKGRKDTDCALVPPGIIHLPTINERMEYEIPNFLAVIACPFGFSSRPGTFIFEGFGQLTRLVVSSTTSVIDAPYVEFKRTYENKNIGTGDTCSSKNIKSLSNEGAAFHLLSYKDCVKAMNKEGIFEMRIRTGGIKGCYVNKVRPTIGIFSSGGVESPCPVDYSGDNKFASTTQFFCREGEDNDGLAGDFARANCFRCPGNSITGPSSTACTTCFANQMKVFEKEAIQKITEGSAITMRSDDLIIGNGKIIVDGTVVEPDRYNAILQNYDLILNDQKQGWSRDHLFTPVTPVELALSDCYLICSHMDKKEGGITAVGLALDLASCVCSTGQEPGLNTQDSVYTWLKTSGGTIVGNPSGTIVGNPYEKIGNGFCRAAKIKHVWITGTTDAVLVRNCGTKCKTVTVNGQAPTGFIVGTTRGHIEDACYCEMILTPCNRIREDIYDVYQYTNVMEAMEYTSWSESALPLCAACQPGQSSIQGCTSCSVGKFTATPQDAQALSCKPCAMGRYTPDKKSTGCKDCTVGTYQDQLSQSICKSCLAGQYQDGTGEKTCKSCPAGYVTTTVGSPSCKICTAGTYQNLAGRTSCIPCQANHYSTIVGASACKACPMGYSHLSTTACQGCASGKYQSNMASATCIPCAQGQYSPSTHRTTTCINCPSGQHAIATGAKRCEWCSGGTLCSRVGPGTQCAAGTYAAARVHINSCSACIAEQSSAAGSRSCTWCPSGRTTNGAVTGRACVACPTNGWAGQVSSTSYSISTGNVKYKSNPYHSCPWGGSNWGCAGKGGRRKMVTFITVLVTGKYYLYLGPVDDWASIQFRHLPSYSDAGYKSLTIGQSTSYSWDLQRGQRVSIDYLCDNYKGKYKCTLFIKYAGQYPLGLHFHQTDPGSAYCADPGFVKRL